jgi:hypothetical protein
VIGRIGAPASCSPSSSLVAHRGRQQALAAALQLPPLPPSLRRAHCRRRRCEEVAKPLVARRRLDRRRLLLDRHRLAARCSGASLPRSNFFMPE